VAILSCKHQRRPTVYLGFVNGRPALSRT
jgi:hypothetical protein